MYTGSEAEVSLYGSSLFSKKDVTFVKPHVHSGRGLDIVYVIAKKKHITLCMLGSLIACIFFHVRWIFFQN